MGDALLNHFSKHLATFDENINDQSDYDLIGFWDSGLKTYIPALEKSLKQPEVEEIQDSINVFKITLG